MSTKCTCAVILVGGYGTRLRPLTLTRPKPLVPFVNIPIITHQIVKLCKCGIRKVILATNYRTKDIINAMKVLASDLDIEIIFSVEEKAMGTGGPLALAREYIDDTDSVFVLNSDIICEYPFDELFNAHIKGGRRATILITAVEDPSRYGVVIRRDDVVLQFVEKPSVFINNMVNAGIYVMSRDLIEEIPPCNVSLEKDVFSHLAARGELTGFELKGYWRDIGQPNDYLKAQNMYLHHHKQSNCIDDTVKMKKETQVDGNVVVGKDVCIGMGVYLKNCTIMDSTVIEDFCVITDSIIGFKCMVNKWCRIENMCVIADDVEVERCVSLNGCMVLPNKTVVKSSQNGIIM